ncbi:hypothetical protein [Kineosporia babensis]|uniref:Uncharacterized protein n=1 Tax=Kineosporia babensis TaxID=499548 RepID=A0A9X1SYV1_9ACTN|nr:hypothetical protein [Kineosporia babensis]MCD5317274.1 hypothetical protein [Kineosporia babensis]
MRSKDLAVRSSSEKRPGQAPGSDGALVRRPLGEVARSFALRFLGKAGAHTVMVCSQCELTGGPFTREEAAHLLRIHEQLHHGIAMHRSSPLPPAF